MPHSVTGFITKNTFVNQISSKYPFFQAVPLDQGFSLFPLTRELLDSHDISHSRILEDIGAFPNTLTNILAELSTIAALLYFETEYFGGEESQLAIVFENGKIVLGPIQGSVGPINDGLHLLGVEIDEDVDEFDALSLGKHRYSTDWLK